MTTLKAETRDKNVKAKRLRREGYVTGNVFGREITGSIPVKIGQREVERLLKTSNKGSQLMLEVDGKTYDVLIKEIDYDAMKNQGKAGNSLKMMSEESGENYKLIQRYIWLARLNDDLLALVDNKQLGMVQGVSLSVLQEKEQEAVYDAICRHKMKLSTVQANTIKQLSVEGKFNEQILERYLTSAQKQKRKKEITLKNERLSEYFEEETTEEEMMNIIFELLETWKRKKGSAQNE